MSAPLSRIGSAFTRRRLVLAAAVVAGSLLLALALRPSPIPVDVATVVRGPMRVTLDEEGETRVHDRYVVSAPIAGRILRIGLEPGDAVAAGRTVLATIRPVAPALLDVRARAEVEARIAAADAALGRARAEQDRAAAEVAQAEREIRRSRELAAAGALAPERLETGELAVQTLRTAAAAAAAGVRAAEAELGLARASLIAPGSRDTAGAAPLQLRAPADGVVLRRLRESEAVVAQGEPLLEVGDVSKIEVVADFLSTDAVSIREGFPVIVERWGGGEPIRGVVRRIEPSGFTKVSALGVDEQRVNVIVELAQPGEALARLGDRYRVEVRVIVWEAADVLRAPISSLVRDGDGWIVFAVEGGQVRRTPVEIGQRSATDVQILKGLAAGARVVAFPGDDLEDGRAVEAGQPGGG